MEEPSVFYSSESSGGDRGDHSLDTHLQVYPDGVYARVGLVYDPDEVAEVSQGLREPWECSSLRFEWPRDGIEWAEKRHHTALGGVYWDNERQLLWLVVGMPSVKFLAYEIIADDSRPEEPMRLPEGWEEQSNIESPSETPEKGAIKITVSPNPFNPTTLIHLSGINSSELKHSRPSLTIYNTQGHAVAIAGRDSRLKKYGNEYRYVFDGSALSSGTYIINLRLKDKNFNKRITFLK